MPFTPYVRTFSLQEGENAIFWAPISLRNIKMLPSKAFLINFQSISLHWICQELGIAGQHYNKGQVISEFLKKQCKKLTNFSGLVSKKWLNHKIKALEYWNTLNSQMLLFCWLNHFLDSRADICQNFELFFWKIYDIKKTFWN